MTVPSVKASPWAAPRRRAESVRERHAFAGEVLTLYLALLEVWEESWDAARTGGGPEGQGGGEKVVSPQDLPGWCADRVLPRVIAATTEHGPASLANAMKGALGTLSATRAPFTALLHAWLAGEELEPVERYLARATLHGPLSAVDAAAACAADPTPRGERRCPTCGGPPQLSFRTDTGDSLVSGQRKLRCARCGDSWGFSGSACAYCGETGGGKRTVYTEHHDEPRVGRGEPGSATFGHIRVEACTSCQRYLIDIDCGRDPRAVPEVDELVALPLDLYAAEHGLSKITPNLMGF